MVDFVDLAPWKKSMSVCGYCEIGAVGGKWVLIESSHCVLIAGPTACVCPLPGFGGRGHEELQPLEEHFA